MSSLSSFVCLSSNPSSEQALTGSQVSSFAIVDVEHAVQPSFSDYDRLSDMELMEVRSMVEEMKAVSAIVDDTFEAHSVQSVDTVKQFVFGNFDFYRNVDGGAHSECKSSSWTWTKRTKRKRKKRRYGRLTNVNTLGVIDEDGVAEAEAETESDTVLDVANLNAFIDQHIMNMSCNMESVISLCNRVSKHSMLSVNGIDIKLDQIPLIGLKLRDMLFRKLILVSDDSIQSETRQRLRRQFWLKLSWSSRMLLTPFGSFDEFRELYGVHPSVRSNELMAVVDEDSFNILDKAEWVRVCLFEMYIDKIRHWTYEQRRKLELDKNRQMSEIRSLVHFGLRFNDERHNIQRFQQEQLSFITSESHMRHALQSSDSIAAFDALERDLQMQIQMDRQFAESLASGTIVS